MTNYEIKKYIHRRLNDIPLGDYIIRQSRIYIKKNINAEKELRKISKVKVEYRKQEQAIMFDMKPRLLGQSGGYSINASKIRLTDKQQVVADLIIKCIKSKKDAKEVSKMRYKTYRLLFESNKFSTPQKERIWEYVGRRT